MTALMMVTVAYFAHKNNWGADTKFEWPRVAKAGMELLVVIAWPFSIWGLIKAGLNPAIAIGIAIVVLFAPDWKFKFEAVLPIITPVLLIGGMVTGTRRGVAPRRSGRCSSGSSGIARCRSGC